jgi:hypothetical protein
LINFVWFFIKLQLERQPAEQRTGQTPASICNSNFAAATVEGEAMFRKG